MRTAPTVAVIDYGMGNLRSVAKAVEAAGATVRIVTRPAEIGDAAGLVLPGVGALADCVTALKSGGLDRAVADWIKADRPFLGVCLGLQALFDFSEEADTPGLGIFPGKVVRFRVPAGLKIPHMGWNTVRFTQPGSALTAGLKPDGEAFYFVHSYHCVPADPTLVLGECEYGGTFTAAIARGRCFATQFHPEKSQAKGIQLYRNFVAVAAQ
ncbi:MAG: imidazole glycerol phosphate synthase subunit HisH [Opitutaceae bacterium]|nr:imidazole glycerol phosphate synthase subunit HisH [Opitutaceae bacterium]